MRALLKGAGLALLLTTAAAPARADSIDELLLRLKEKGILTEAEYQAIVSRKTTEAAAPAPAAGGTAAVTTGETGQPAQEAAAERLDARSVQMTESGVGFQMGGVTLKFSGSVNGFYTHDSGARDIPSNVIVGGLATVGDDSSSVRNGLLPGFLLVDVTTNQGGWDVGAHFGLYPGINSVTQVGGANSAGNPTALGTSGIDARKTYLTFGKPNFGEIKIGRDIGIFASDAILNDITLLGVGTAAGNSSPSNTSIGRIGVGYIYTDFMPQITYTSPSFSGLQVTVGAFQPLVTAGSNEINDTPGFQGKITYDYKFDDLSGRVWVGGVVQRHDETLFSDSYTGSAIDVGATLKYAGLGLFGYYYRGSGVGTTGLFILSSDGFEKRDSDGFIAQATYTVDKITVGASYGESNLELADGEIDPLLLQKNSSYVGQLRYGLTSWVNLVGEYTHTISEAQGGNEADSDAIALGAILFF